MAEDKIIIVNKLFQLAGFSHKGSVLGTTQKTHKTEVMGKILVAGKRREEAREKPS